MKAIAALQKIILLHILLLCNSQVFAQQESEFIKLTYTHSGRSIFSNSPHPTMNQIVSANSVLSATINYGHDLKSYRWKAIYSLNYSHFSQELDVTAVKDEAAFQRIPANYYQYPNFSQLSLSGGINVIPASNWSATLIGALNFTDDIGKAELASNLTWLTMAYLERKHHKNLSYGVGVFINQLENKLLLTPSVSLRVNNAKRGLEVLFPEKIRLWQKLKQKNYLEASIMAKSLSVEYAEGNPVRGLDIYTIKAGAAYNFLWSDFLKFTLGIDFPFIVNSLTSTHESFDFFQQNSIGFNLGLAVVFSEE